MELLTPRFGGIPFAASEILVFENGLVDHPSDRQWLLTADANDHRLYWLQCISNVQVAVPVVDIAEFNTEYEIAGAIHLLERFIFKPESRLLALAPVLFENDELSIGLDVPIVIDTKCGIGLQLRNERYQPLQRLTSEPPITLRKCA